MSKRITKKKSIQSQSSRPISWTTEERREGQPTTKEKGAKMEEIKRVTKKKNPEHVR